MDQLARLPGFGPKTALRCAMTLLKWPEAEARRLGNSIFTLRDNLCLCSRCSALTDTDPCPVCSDSRRDRELLCLVSDWDSMLILEEGAFFPGLYLILGGLLAPLENVHPDALELGKLDARLAGGEVKEVILALGTTVDAENTESFIRSRVSGRYPHIKISRLAQGIPLGSEVKFMDKETLRQSLRYRQEL